MKKFLQKHKKSNFDVVNIINLLLDELSDREADILIRRFGLNGRNKETLENVGKEHDLTRERIRQIESLSIKKLVELEKFEKELKILKRLIKELIQEHGGIMEKDYLFDNLLYFSKNVRKDDIDSHKSYFEFLISKLLKSEIEEVNNLNNFKRAYRVKGADVEHFEEILDELHDIVLKRQEILRTKELLAVLAGLESVKRHQEKLAQEYQFDISHVLGNDFFEEHVDEVNDNKILYSMLVGSKKIEQNRFGHWGAHDSREIKPKTINHKIYLVLKNHEKPMHFAEIADQINNVGFDKKTSNVATVHNELILDPKYVLVGRGLYGLKEWGYKEGTVADIIKQILSESNSAMTRDEIIEKVLESRFVKKTTIILALMDRNNFKKAENGYLLK